MSQSELNKTQTVARKRFNNLPLQTRMVLFMLSLALIPLIIITTRDTIQTQQALTNVSEASLKSSAEQTTNNLDTFIQVTLDSLAIEARFFELTTYLSLSPTPPPIIKANAINLLKKLKGKSNYIISYALLDAKGNVVLDTAGGNTENNEAGEVYFQQVMDSEKPIVSVITYSADQTTSITFASKVLDINVDQDLLGVLRVKYDSAILQDYIIQNSGASEDTSVLLLDQYGIRMADTRNPELILKSLIPLEQEEYLLAVETHRLLSIPSEEQATNYFDFKSALDNAENQPVFNADITPEIEGGDTIAVAFLKTQPWAIAYSRPTSIFLTDVQKQLRTNILLIIVVSVLITIIATVAVRSLARPIISLTKTANSISQGDLSARSEIDTMDEIGQLANTFNTMSSQIQDLVTSLEQRVEQRTAELTQRSNELAQTTQQSEKRAEELQTIAEIARYISTEKHLDKLLPLITQVVSDRFGYYHVGIFLLNETKKYAILRAANSLGGQKMLERNHKLEVGQEGIVGNVTDTGRPRIALDTGADASYFNNPDLPETHSEMALPLATRGTIIGALDVQSTVPNAFTETDISILGLLADQLAIAIDNVRLIEETQNALEESQYVFREYLAGAWRQKSASQISGYHQTPTSSKLVTGDTTEKIKTLTDNDTNTLAIPIRIHEQAIGTVNIRSNNSSRVWSKDEVNIVKAVVERLGLALDNARLFEETSTRAERERLVSDITTKIRTTNDPQEMIQTALNELKMALGVTHVEIVPKKMTPPDS